MTCAIDHRVPRCSDCGCGWCKIAQRCFSCTVDAWFENPRCNICRRGFKKLGLRCFFAAVLQSQLSSSFPSFASSSDAHAVLDCGFLAGPRCVTCFFDQFISRCPLAIFLSAPLIVEFFAAEGATRAGPSSTPSEISADFNWTFTEYVSRFRALRLRFGCVSLPESGRTRLRCSL